MKQLLESYRSSVSNELEQILSYWMQYSVDDEQGGFYGRINNDNAIDSKAAKGSVLNSRILWAFAAAYRQSGKKEYLAMAQRAFDYISKYFIDKEYGGVYWTVDNYGKPLDTKKQVYGLAFAIYGISEYMRCQHLPEAKEIAMSLVHCIEQYSYDNKHTGYLEAFTREWKDMQDLRLSAKDANEKKTMNTHLHVLEAYANLYRVSPNDFLKDRIAGLIHNFLDYFIDKQSHHLILFFDENWNPRPGPVSYGHDIETAWLLQEAAEVIGEVSLVKAARDNAVSMTNAAMEGMDVDGGLWYEYEPLEKHLIREKHSWPQAEAMVGLFNAWQVSGKEQYLQQSYNSWKFVRQYIKDHTKGEWFWGVLADHSPMLSHDKAGIWKCPYHNSRACLEIIHRATLSLGSISQK